jgi:Glu-tRNA(Gln) amidotransferase subunit E-like FAD-binding protein
MSNRVQAVLILLILSASLAIAKDKKKNAVLPAYVLDANTVAVVIIPDSPAPVTNPNANREAQDAVEQALMKWGRLKPTIDTQDADLVIAIRKGARSLLEHYEPEFH